MPSKPPRARVPKAKPLQTQEDKALHRLYCTSHWQRIRQSILSADPLCAECARQDKITPATVVDHIIPHKGDLTLFYDTSNLQPLCKRCHDIKTVREDGGFGNMITQRKPVYLVCGSPGSGKSYWVNQQKGPDDLVIDLDLICAALHGDMDATHRDHAPVLDTARIIRGHLYELIRGGVGEWKQAWVITSTSSVTEIRSHAQALKAEIILADASLEECITRITSDPRRVGRHTVFEQLAKDWHKRFKRDTTDGWMDTNTWESLRGGKCDAR